MSTAFTLPYALVQPLLGAAADHFGKTRLMTGCLLIVALAALVGAVATSFSLLVAMRIAAGLVAGGLFPVALAIIGDLVPVNQRQVAIGRLLAFGLTGNLVGASIAGVIGDVFGWRGVFLVFGLFALTMTMIAFFAFRGPTTTKAGPFRLASVAAGFRSVFADPRAKICFGSVFLEGIFIQGLFPYVAILLLATGEARASLAGLVIAAFGLGGVLYSFSVPVFVRNYGERRLMLTGGALAACALVLVALGLPWYVSDTARGAATSLHSCAFYLGQAAGPVFYGFTFAHGASTPSIIAGAMVVLGVSMVCARLLRHPIAPEAHG